MFVVKYFTKLGFESFGSFFESSFCSRHVPDHCVQSFRAKDNNSERHKEEDFCSKAHPLILGGALGGRTGQVRCWLFFFWPHG